MLSSKRTLLVSVTALLGAASLLISLVPPAALAHTDPADDTNVEWQLDCGIDHFGANDPIVYPGQPGLSHMHSFYGNTTTDANSTAQSLMASRSSCGRDMQTTDHSGYWIPSLYNGSTLVSSREQGMFIYYKRAGGASGPKVRPFPVGLRMIAGDAKATSPQSDKILTWDCGGGGPTSQKPMNCVGSNSGKDIHASLGFPNCWDGVHLDSADHKSHMAYSAANGACDAAHPVSLPSLNYEIDYPGINGNGNYTFSSGSPYSLHGDFFAAWDVRVQNALVTACLNAGKDCIDINRGSGDTLFQPSGEGSNMGTINIASNQSTFPADPKDTPAKTPSPTVLGAATTPTPVLTHSPSPSASPKPDGSLPDTGPVGVIGGAIGLALMLYLGYRLYWRKRYISRAMARAGQDKK